MSRAPKPPQHTGVRCRSLRPGAAAFTLLLVASLPALAQPTVNGLFYGDGDDALYSPYATSQFGSVLYSYYHPSTTTMYVALVVSHAVNDLVCSPKTNKTYTESATPPWGGHRDCKRASDSEFATFTLECAPGSPASWSWQQAVGCALNLTPPESNWVSDSRCGASSPAADWPPGVEANATTSWVANINTYQAAAPATRAWNLYTFGTATGDWKSPFVSSAPNDVTQVPGYPTYSSTDGMGLFYQWEWSMVYEWSVDLGPGGANCGDEVIVFISGTSHHSPGKHGSEDDPFDPAGPLSDWGDLPDSYATTSTAGGARHLIKVTGPYFGTNVQSEQDGVPTADASGDGSEEDGVTANVTSNWTAGSTQSFDVVISNAPAGGALVGGWFDWNGDGDFNDAGEFFTWSGLTDGTHTLSVTVGSGFDWATDDLYARFRIFSDASEAPSGGPSLMQSDSAGEATDGEVEDYHYAAASLPVTLNAFSSDGVAGGPVTVRWQTASETDNVGFELLGLVDGDWQPLGEFVASKGMNSALPQSYEMELFLPARVTRLELVDYDTRGRPERFGPFRPGVAYGELQPVRKVDWSGPRRQRARRLAERGFADTGRRSAVVPPGQERVERWKKVARGERGAARARSGRQSFALDRGGELEMELGRLTHVAVAEHGIQRVTYEALRDGGLDLAGARPGAIAVTWRGQPVARWIESRGRFGPGDWIEFLGSAPSGEEALYLDANLYQVAVDPGRALEMRRTGRGRAKSPSGAYTWASTVDRTTMYHRQSPTGDPWVERTLLVRGSPQTVDLEIPVAGPVLDGPSRLFVGLGSVTDLPDLPGPDGAVIPEHNVEVWFGGPGSPLVHVADSSASGQQDWRIEAELPAGLLQPGVNRLQLRFSTEYFYSLVVIDRYGVRHPGPYLGPELDFPADPEADGYRIEGFASPAVVAYGEHEDGSVSRLAPTVVARRGGGHAAELRQLAALRFWVSERPHRPEVFTTAAPADLLSEPGDLLVITDSSFVGSAALDAYLSARADLRPVVVDVEDVYNAVGYGMALPTAITDYLRIRDEVLPFTHLQLVGTDCYDRLNRLSSCVSFIPLPTARVGVNIYSPSHNRLVDLDGDGVGDKAVGQFSVRDEAELATIVEKGARWSANRTAGGESALWIAEETDGLHDFSAQIVRLRRRLGWTANEMIHMSGHPEIGAAREALRAGLDAGATVTVFSGHSSPSVWAYRALLTAQGVASLTNFERPTLMVPLACETTYDISPDAEVLGHQLLYAGEQGALAISGAVALSSLDQNERMAGIVLDGLETGLTLGEAVQAAREVLGPTFRELQDNWMTQGDAAARIHGQR